MTTDLALDALLAEVWRRKPQECGTVHSDQDSQFSSGEWQSFFQLLKRERIKQHVYATQEAARSDVFDYIEMFYNPRRRHGTSDNLSPVEYERRYFQSLSRI
jgi:putative transposase